MSSTRYQTALIVGAGSGLSAALARVLAKEGMAVALAARTPGDLGDLAKETGAKTFGCDATQRADVDKLFADVDAALGAPDVVIYNASYRVRGPFVDLDPAEVEKSIAVSAFGGFLVAQQAARRMIPKGRGAILLTGASASLKGYAQSAPFAMGKFALRGMALKRQRAGSVRSAFTWRISSSTAESRARAGRNRRIAMPACWTRMPSRRAICTCCISRTARGRPSWSCGHGSSRSDAAG